MLIAEDNSVNMEVAKFHLADLGCHADGVENGALAVAALQHKAFDFILMDCQMPVMDGFSALQRIRADDLASHDGCPAIIAVTAADDHDTRTLCLNAGFDGFLAKPYTRQQLLSALQSVCAGAGRRTTLAPKPDPVPVPVVASGEPPIVDQAVFSQFVAEFGSGVAPALVGSFLKSLRDGEARLPAINAAQDTAALKALAHKLAGAAGTIGATRLAKLARSIEATAKRDAITWGFDGGALKAAIAAAIATFAPLQTSLSSTIKDQPC